MIDSVHDCFNKILCFKYYYDFRQCCHIIGQKHLFPPSVAFSLLFVFANLLRKSQARFSILLEAGLWSIHLCVLVKNIFSNRRMTMMYATTFKS